MKKWAFTIFIAIYLQKSFASSILIPMNARQANHLKAYGLAYWYLKADKELDWLVNYQGGSFLYKYASILETECLARGITYEVISDKSTLEILINIADADKNMDVVKLHKSAKIAVYSPIKVSQASYEDTDAVLLVLKYAEIPFEIVYDEEVMNGELAKYDWLHLHHEDFTGQYGKDKRRMTFDDVQAQEKIAKKFGFKKVSQLKLEVAKAIKGFCAGGGYLFAMCSGSESLDVALAAEGVDIVDSQYDGDAADPDAQHKLDFEKTIAFGSFLLENGDGGGRGMRSFSNINAKMAGGWGGASGGWGDEEEIDTYFNLFTFSAKWDIIPALLTQNHQFQIREFMGQTNAFNKATVKSNCLIMGTGQNSDRYIYGEIGRGQFAFYGGHDPEGRRGFHRVPTDLNLHPNSPGYRLILNNVLFPSAKKKKRKT